MFFFIYLIIIIVFVLIYYLIFFIGGVKMRYPSCYVLVTDLDESTAELYKNPNTHQTTPQQPSLQHQQQQQQSI